MSDIWCVRSLNQPDDKERKTFPTPLHTSIGGEHKFSVQKTAVKISISALRGGMFNEPHFSAQEKFVKFFTNLRPVMIFIRQGVASSSGKHRGDSGAFAQFYRVLPIASRN